MEQSEQVNELVTATIAAKKLFVPIKKKHTGKIAGEGKGGAYEYSYKYADTADTLEATEAHLLANGIMPSGNTILGDQPGFFRVQIQFTHTSGQWMRVDSPPLPYGNDPKRTGASMTYGRRYCYSLFLNLATEDDTDAAGQWDDRPAQQRQQVQRSQAPAQAAAQPRAQAPANSGNGAGDPGEYVFPIGKDKGYKGKTIKEVPEGYLRHFVMGDTFDKEDIREATSKFLATLATKENLDYLSWSVGHIGGDHEKFQAALDKEREVYFGKVRLRWYEAAEEKLLGKLEPEQLEALRNDYRLFMRQWSGEVDPAEVPDEDEPETLAEFAAKLDDDITL